MQEITLPDLVERLESWNLKYEEFPELLVVDGAIICGFERNTLVVRHDCEVQSALGILRAAMNRRSNNFWGV